MTRLLSATDKQAISDAIRQVESRTSGELVTVITAASDDYLFIPTLWAALIALMIPGILLLSPLWIPYHWIYGIQVGMFFGLAALFRFSALKMRLIPKAIQSQRAHQVAREQFYLQNLANTKGRTGVLIFVSLAERYVEIIADQGINDVVAAGAWQKIVNGFVEQVKAGEIKAGFTTTISGCGELLVAHFPAAQDNVDELPNHLVELS